MLYALTVLAFGSLVLAIIVLSYKNGHKAQELENLKAELRKEIKERERVKKISDSVNNMSISDARDRLQDISNKQ